jgi:hypothetical protein
MDEVCDFSFSLKLKDIKKANLYATDSPFLMFLNYLLGKFISFVGKYLLFLQYHGHWQ